MLEGKGEQSLGAGPAKLGVCPPPARFGADPRQGPPYPPGAGAAYVTRRKGL